MLNGEEKVVMAQPCSHENAAAKFNTIPKGINFETHIQFVCPDCKAVATIYAAGGPVDTGRILWTWNPVTKGVNTPRGHNDAAAKIETSKQHGDPKKGLPGTEMLLLTKELGIHSPAGCGCKSMALNMDRLGLDECRARLPDLKLMVAGNWASWGWKDKLSAVSAAAWKAAGLGVNPTDPVRDLLEIALERAEAKIEK